MSDLSLKPGDPQAIVASASVPEYVSHTLNVSGSPVNVPSTRLSEQLAGHVYPFALSRSWRSPTVWSEVVGFARDVGTLNFEARSPREDSLFAELDDACVVIEYDHGYNTVYTVTVAAASEKIAHRYMDAFTTFIGTFPPPPPPEPLPYNIVPVDFWMQDPMSGSGYSRRRNIQVQKWDEVAGNYPESLREDLAELMGLDDPSGGKLVLFHGPPGTGKTRAILTLFSEWREWCGPSVVTDADRLFADATYLNSIVFNSGGQGWLLLVIEDGDEFMNVSSRESKGQSIARLLNLADGIVGQGVNLLTLISTNVDMKQLNPAVIRSGRCMKNLHFGEFPADEAQAWLDDHGVEFEVDKPMSLADLYAIKAGKDPEVEFGDVT